MPPQPEKLRYVPTYPAFQPVDRPPVLSQLEVLPPASYKALPAISQLLAREALATLPEVPYFRFESLDTFRSYSDLQFSVQSKAQELAFPNLPCPAFGFVHLRSEEHTSELQSPCNLVCRLLLEKQ